MLGHARVASAAITFKGDDGWAASIDGYLNLFMVDTFGPARPTGGAADLFSRATSDNSFRVRTGFLPSKLGFSVDAPEWNGIKTGLHIGIYPQLNNGDNASGATTRTSINPNIDWRQFYATFDGAFGQVLVGRTLNLYQSDAILNDISLFGVGIPGANAFAGGPTLGHIGFGYSYSAWDAQFRYTTPSFSGLTFAVAVVDPSSAPGAPLTTMPTLEGKLSFAQKGDAVAVRGWVDGIYNKAKAPTGASVTGYGGAAGLGVGVGALDVLATGYLGSGIGDATQLDGGVDGQSTYGLLAQVTYRIDATKLGANYGQSWIDQSAAGTVKNRRSITGGIYHDLNAWLKLVAEFSWYQINTNPDVSQSGEVASVGGFLFW